MSDHDDIGQRLERIEDELQAGNFWRAFAWVWFVIVVCAVGFALVVWASVD